MDIECEICCQKFDLGKRSPKLFPCGHTSCSFCCKNVGLGIQDSVCPFCRAEVPKNGVADNFSIVQILKRFNEEMFEHKSLLKNEIREEIDKMIESIVKKCTFYLQRKLNDIVGNFTKDLGAKLRFLANKNTFRYFQDREAWQFDEKKLLVNFVSSSSNKIPIFPAMEHRGLLNARLRFFEMKTCKKVQKAFGFLTGIFEDLTFCFTQSIRVNERNIVDLPFDRQKMQETMSYMCSSF